MIWTDRARRDLRNLDSATAIRVIRAVDRLATSEAGDVKRVRGRGEEWRLRVARWRVRFVFNAAAHAVEVLRVLPRGSAYRD